MNVLLGIGASADAFDALEETVERAREAGDELTVAILATPATTHDADDTEARVRSRLSEAGLDADIEHVEGDPGGGLVELADSGDFDRIVLGGGDRSPLGKITLGEVSEFVLLNAETSVTLVR